MKKPAYREIQDLIQAHSIADRGEIWIKQHLSKAPFLTTIYTAFTKKKIL